MGATTTGATGPCSVCGVRIAPPVENPPGAARCGITTFPPAACPGCPSRTTPQPPPATTATIAAAAAARIQPPSSRSAAGHASTRPVRGALRKAATTRASNPSGAGSPAISRNVSSYLPAAPSSIKRSPIPFRPVFSIATPQHIQPDNRSLISVPYSLFPIPKPLTSNP